MPINSRNKGAQFERDIAKILNGFFLNNGIDYETKRNLDQYQQKDLCDLNIPHHAVECKFYKDGASSNDDIPVLIFKFNRKPVRVCIPLYAVNYGWPKDNDKVCILSMDDWLAVLQKNWRDYESL